MEYTTLFRVLAEVMGPSVILYESKRKQFQLQSSGIQIRQVQ